MRMPRDTFCLLSCVLLSWHVVHAQVNQFNQLNVNEANVCTPQAQSQIRNVCSRTLASYGIFTPSSQGGGLNNAPNPMTWDSLRRRSRQLFQQICTAFEDWDRCVSPYKTACWYQEPIKGEFTVAHEALAYACRPPAYSEMLQDWDCFLQASTRSDLIMCDARIMADARGGSYTNLREGDTACRILQDYVGCIRNPIYEQCGARAWTHVREVFQRPTRVYLPYCTLAGAVPLPSLLLTLVFAIAVCAYYKQ